MGNIFNELLGKSCSPKTANIAHLTGMNHYP